MEKAEARARSPSAEGLLVDTSALSGRRATPSYVRRPGALPEPEATIEVTYDHPCG